MDYSKISNLEFEGVDHSDYPDFCDAYISYGYYDGEPMTDQQLNEINEDRDFVYENLISHLF